MGRVLTMKNVYDKVFKLLPLQGEWLEALGHDTENSGVWLIYGKEKNGKTTFALRMADYLSTMETVLYISAEEGISVNIQNTCKRLNISDSNKNLHLDGYISLEDLRKRLKKRKSEQIIFLDNTTEYATEIKRSDLSQLIKDFPSKLFIFLAHEGTQPKGEPDNALAKFCKKKAKRFFHVEGMVANVGGRTGAYTLSVDKETAALCHGDSINEQKQIS